MSIPISQFIPHPLPPWCPYVCSLRLRLHFCFANKFIYIIFLYSTNERCYTFVFLCFISLSKTVSVSLVKQTSSQQPICVNRKHSTKPALYRTATSPDSQMLSVGFYRILSGVCKFAAFTDAVTFPDGMFALPGSQHPPFLIFHTTLGVMPKIG